MAPQEEKRAFAGLCIASLLLSAPATAQFTFPTIAPPRTDANACREINSQVLPELSAVTAEWLPAGPPRPATAGAAPLAALPAHCRVSATVPPAIRIEVWLPASAAWNGRFLGFGSTGTGGMLNPAGMAAALTAGYATASTDDGHRPEDLSWLGDERQLRDFAYRATHEMTAQSRAFVAHFYGRPADYRYFSGCALGGHQGLMEAAHFPDDYDGIVAGSPSPAFVADAITRLASQAAIASAAEPDPFTLAFFRLAVFADPGWNWRGVDLTADMAFAREAAGWIDVNAADLGRFGSRGGRLIIYQGSAEYASSAEAMIDWYESAAAVDPAGTARLARLFMVPGMAQCGGNALALDLQRAVEAWVERGIAPDRIDTTVDSGDAAVGTRTLCPYVQRAGAFGPAGSARESDRYCTN